MTLAAFLFYLLAALTTVSALAVVVTGNLARSASWLFMALGGVAGIYFLLGAEFIGGVQILIYNGGILILILLGGILTAQGSTKTPQISAGEWLMALVAGLILFSTLCVSLSHLAPVKGAPLVANGTRSLASTNVLSQAMLGIDRASPPGEITGVAAERIHQREPLAYLLPFGLLALHLLLVMVGAGYLVRIKRQRGATP